MRPGSVSGTGCLRAGAARALGFLVLAILVVGLWLGFDVLEAPWSYPLLNRPTLTGHWAGTFTTPSGIHFAMYLEIERQGGSSELSGDLLSGRAYWCDNQGRRVENSPLSGSVPMFSGHTGTLEPVDLQIEPTKTAPTGLWPVSLHGSWRLDTLTLRPDLPIYTGTGMQTSSSNPDQNQPITFNLKKAELDAYQSTCAQLGH